MSLVAVFGDGVGEMEECVEIVESEFRNALAETDGLRGRQGLGMSGVVPLGAPVSESWIVGSGESLAPVFPIVQGGAGLLRDKAEVA